jgi:DNA-binding NarL/FixJ family response regulator
MEEIWKDVPGWEGIYQISNLSRIRCIRVTYFEGDDFGDCIRVTLSDNERKERHPIHRLVAQAFIGIPAENLVVNHKDGNKRNNRVDNLEWVTQSENMKHALRTGLKKILRGEEINKKLTTANVIQILELIKNGISNMDIATQFNVSHTMISQIRNNHVWKHIERK